MPNPNGEPEIPSGLRMEDMVPQDPPADGGTPPAAGGTPPPPPPEQTTEDFLAGSELNSRNIPPELQGTYKQMQAHFTRRTQEATKAVREQKELEEKFNRATEALNTWAQLAEDAQIFERLQQLSQNPQLYTPYRNPSGAGYGGQRGMGGATPAATPFPTRDELAAMKTDMLETLRSENDAAIQLGQFINEVGPQEFAKRQEAISYVLAGIKADPRNAKKSPRERLELAWTTLGATLPTARPGTPPPALINPNQQPNNAPARTTGGNAMVPQFTVPAGQETDPIVQAAMQAEQELVGA